MTLNRKLAANFLIIAIIPIFITFFVVYSSAKEVMIRQTINTLTAVADIQEQRVNEILGSYLQELRMVKSHTELRVSLEEYGNGGRKSAAEKIQNIISDAKAADHNIVGISVFDSDGVTVASTDQRIIGEHHGDDDFFLKGREGNLLHGLLKDDQNTLLVRLAGPFMWNKKIIGVAEVIISAAPFIAVTEDFAGLGDTGEVVLAKKNAEGDALVLTPLRYNKEAALRVSISSDDPKRPITRSLNGTDEVLSDSEFVDYRGKQVIAVTRFIEALGWGLVAKIDRSEALAPSAWLLNVFLIVLAITLVLILIFALLLARSITLPVRNLTFVAQKLKEGDLSQRIQDFSTDEVGILGMVFNDMAIKLQAYYKDLEHQVKERTRDSKKFQDAVDASTDAIAITLPNLEYVYVNPSWERLTGYSSKEALGQSASLILSDKTDPELIKKQLDIVNTEEEEAKLHSDQFIHKRKDGSEYNAENTVYSIREDGKISFYVLVHRDITGRKRVDAAKSEFVSLASHQLRTPLTEMRWALSSLEQGKLTDKQMTIVKNAHKASAHMAETIKAMLTISHIETGELNPEPTDVSLHSLINDIVSLYDAMQRKKKIALTIDCSQDIHVLTDEQLLKEILSNLLTNAYKYTPGGGNVHISVKQEKEHVSIDVVDTGFGIPRDQQKRVSEKFFRGSNVVDKEEEGNGIGLNMVYSLVKLLGGTISFISQENKGTTFTLTFPRSV